MKRIVASIMLSVAVAGWSRGAEVTIFDGKSLNGWTGDQQLWKVVDGTIVGQSPGLDYNTFLILDRDAANFSLSFQCKLDANNSGVQFRSKVVDPAKYVMAGYQADIAPAFWGLLYDEKGRGKLDFNKDTSKLVKLNEWATYVIRADGPNITISVNGIPTVSYVEMDEKRGAKSGKIGLQLHAGPPMTVAFKDIRFTELP